MDMVSEIVSKPWNLNAINFVMTNIQEFYFVFTTMQSEKKNE